MCLDSGLLKIVGVALLWYVKGCLQGDVSRIVFRGFDVQRSNDGFAHVQRGCLCMPSLRGGLVRRSGNPRSRECL